MLLERYLIEAERMSDRALKHYIKILDNRCSMTLYQRKVYMSQIEERYGSIQQRRKNINRSHRHRMAFVVGLLLSLTNKEAKRLNEYVKGLAARKNLINEIYNFSKQEFYDEKISIHDIVNALSEQLQQSSVCK